MKNGKIKVESIIKYLILNKIIININKRIKIKIKKNIFKINKQINNKYII